MVSLLRESFLKQLFELLDRVRYRHKCLDFLYLPFQLFDAVSKTKMLVEARPAGSFFVDLWVHSVQLSENVSILKRLIDIIASENSKVLRAILDHSAGAGLSEPFGAI